MSWSFGKGLLMGYGALRSVRNLGFIIFFAVTWLTSAAIARAEPITIAALGDSLTQGYGLPDGEGFVPQLQSWLQSQGSDAVLINAGVSGDTTAGGLSRVAWTLTPDVDAMILELGANDFLRGIDPAVSRENLRGILEAAKAQGVEVLLVGLEVSTNYGADYKTAFDKIYPDLAAEFGATLYPTFFDGLLAEGDLETARATYLQEDGLHPNAEGVIRIVAAMGPAVLDLAAKAAQ